MSETERGEISAYLNVGLSQREIARKSGRNVSTISREIKRGSVPQLNSNYETSIKYFPDTGARVYKENRGNCGAHSTAIKAWEFLGYAEKKILQDQWSPDAVVGCAKRQPQFKEHTYPQPRASITGLIRESCQ